MIRLAVLLLCVLAAPSNGGQAASDAYLAWSSREATAIGEQGYRSGRVGGVFDLRVLKTERSYNYKLAATWLTPDVIRATARLLQLQNRLSEPETRALVSEAASAGPTVVMIEIDPREGSGVIPNEWQAFLQPKGRPESAVRGTMTPALREVKALAGVRRCNYDYDRFWVVFPLTGADGKPLFGPADGVAEVVVRIHDKEGRVEWPIPRDLTFPK